MGIRLRQSSEHASSEGVVSSTSEGTQRNGELCETVSPLGKDTTCRLSQLRLLNFLPTNAYQCPREGRRPQCPRKLGGGVGGMSHPCSPACSCGAKHASRDAQNPPHTGAVANMPISAQIRPSDPSHSGLILGRIQPPPHGASWGHAGLLDGKPPRAGTCPVPALKEFAQRAEPDAGLGTQEGRATTSWEEDSCWPGSWPCHTPLCTCLSVTHSSSQHEAAHSHTGPPLLVTCARVQVPGESLLQDGQGQATSGCVSRTDRVTGDRQQERAE